MTGPLGLAARHARHHIGRSVILAACVAVACTIPLLVRLLVRDFQKALVARAVGTPLLIGAKGNRLDLTMAMLYFRRVELGTVSFAEFLQLSAAADGVYIPINLRFTARGHPLVATTPDYFELRGMRLATGTQPLILGDVVVGARTARELLVQSGGSLFSDQRELFDLSKPPALKLHVVGVLAPVGGPEDEAVFTDIKTAWILEGLSHAHLAPADAPPRLVLDRSAQGVTLSEELIDYNEVTPENLASFHVHADDAHLPLSGVIVVPASVKVGTLLSSRINAGRALQAVVPQETVDDLLAYVFRLRALIDGVSVLLGMLTSVLVGMVTALSIRVRARELETLRRIGVARSTIAAMFAWEIALLLLAGMVAAVGFVAAVSICSPNLVKLL